MFFIWKSNTKDENLYTRASIVDAKSLSHLKLTLGNPLYDSLPTVKIEIISASPPADYFKAGPLFIASQKLKEILEAKKVGAEYHPVNILRNNSTLKQQSYFFVNIIEKINCIDPSTSIYTKKGDYVDRIKKLSIDESVLKNKHLFRLDGCIDVITLISQELSEEILSKHLTGMAFQKLES